MCQTATFISAKMLLQWKSYNEFATKFSHLYSDQFFIVEISMHFLNGSNFRPRFNGKKRERIQPSKTVYTFHET